MDKKKTIFQIVIAGIFAAMLLVGFTLFTIYRPNTKKDKVEIGSVVIWGTLDSQLVGRVLAEIKENDERFSHVEYVEKSKKTYNQDILEALAAQKSPDLILLSNEDFLKNRNKIYPITEQFLTKRNFYNTYADAFSIYLARDGILGIPFIVDPMVMYYNKTMFSSNRVVVTPKNWEEFEKINGIISKIRRLDDSGNILKTAIAFGEGNNIRNFKEILFTLFLQKDNFIFQEGQGRYFSDKKGFQKTSEIINFYTQFANQANKIKYSWNRSMPDSEEVFLAENLATYFGFSSDLLKLRYKNPNLNFDVAEIPTFKDSTKKTVYARTWAFAIPKASKNKRGAFETALKFASKNSQKKLVSLLHLPPVRKDLLNEIQEDPYMDIFFREAVYSYSVMDPNSQLTNNLFDEYITNVNTGLKSPGEATNVLLGELDELLGKNNF